MTAGQGSTFEDPTELITTSPIEVTHQTTGSSMTSSSSRGAGFYLQYAVVVIGVVGTTANGLVLYAMVASKQHKKHVLIFNQNLLDFVSCLFLVATYTFRLCSVYLDGTLGYWLCITLWGEGCSWAPYLGSLINLAAVTIERYLKVVHRAWAKQKLSKSIIHSAAAFAWIGGIVTVVGVTIPTTDVVGGVCYTMVFFKSQAGRMVYGIWQFLSFYAIILLICIFCYGRILTTVRRQANVMAAHSAGGSSAGQAEINKMEAGVIKTMMLVSILFTISWAPASVYSLIWYTGSNLKLNMTGLHIAAIMGYLYTCTNPFIYATKFDPVKRVLQSLISCKRATQVPEIIEVT